MDDLNHIILRQLQKEKIDSDIIYKKMEFNSWVQSTL